MHGRLIELKQDIGRRLRSVLQHLPQAEFDALVERMAYIQFKYEQRRRGELLIHDELESGHS